MRVPRWFAAGFGNPLSLNVRTDVAERLVGIGAEGCNGSDTDNDNERQHDSGL